MYYNRSKRTCRLTIPKWSVSDVMKFLHIYRKHECLWNPNNEKYNHKKAKEIALNEIVAELNIPQITPLDIKLKIKSIRTGYKRELRLLEENQSDYIPKLFWFKVADSFLRNVSMKHRFERNRKKPIEENKLKLESQEGNIIVSNQDVVYDYNVENAVEEVNVGKEEVSSYKINSNDERDVTMTSIEPLSVAQDHHYHHHSTRSIHSENVRYIDEIYSDQTIAKTSSAPTIISSNENITTTAGVQTGTNNIDNSSLTMTVNKSIEDDDYFIFGRSIAAQLRSISDSYSRSVAKFKIQKILFEAETGQYKRQNNGRDS